MTLVTLAILGLTLFIAGCSKDDNNDTTFNIFSVSDDISFGSQLRNEIENNPAEYPILSEEDYPEAYAHVYRIRDSILEHGDLIYADQFEWKVDIIRKGRQGRIIISFYSDDELSRILDLLS